MTIPPFKPASAAHTLASRLIEAWLRLTVSSRQRPRERGDVPGWVLVTLMTAGLVTILYALARDQLTALFTRAINAVTGQP